MKRCSRCGMDKPLSAFHRRTASRDGRQSQCKPCAIACARESALRDPERTREVQRRHNNSARGKRRQRDWHLRKQFGLSLDEYEALRATVTTCATCDATERLDLDHCHKTGRLRGWLCPPCNKALGLVRDNSETLRRLAAYLDEHAMRTT